MPARRSRDTAYHPHDQPRPPSRRHNSPNNTKNTSPGGGLLSSVFSFVSHELGEFVANAMGVAEASTSKSVRGPRRERGERARHVEKRSRRQSTPSHSQNDLHVRKWARRDSGDRHEVHACGENDIVHDVKGKEISPPGPSHRQRRGSISMPGSLFSRSPTPDPRLDFHSPHVRFASDVISPMSRPRRHTASSASQPQIAEHEEECQSEADYDGGASSSPDRADSLYPPVPSPPRRLSIETTAPTTLFRPPAVRSVKDVGTRRDGKSPVRIAGPKAKGKGKEVECAVSWPSIDKSKRIDTVSLSLERDSRLVSAIGSEEGTRGTSSAIKDNVDKRRILELEERVKTLEEELAKRPTVRDLPPAPPPPPPPPVPGSLTSIIPTLPRRKSDLGGIYTSVRAGLRQTSDPSEKPKAIPRNRLPTVPADHMEAFLNELKTVRLRKVRSGDDLRRDSTASSMSNWSSLDHSVSSSRGNISLQEDRLTLGQKRKRVDSGNEAQSALFTSIKRRFNVQPQPNTSTSSSITAGPESSSKALIAPHNPPGKINGSSIIPPSRDYGTTPSLCSDNDNDIEERGPSTPPLVTSKPASEGLDRIATTSTEIRRVEVQAAQDGDREPEIGDTNDRLEMPTKAPRRRSATKDGRTHTSIAGQGSEVRAPRLNRQKTDGAEDPFARRLPSSPILPETPRKPRPPGRVRNAGKVALCSRGGSEGAPVEDDEEDESRMRFSSPERESTPLGRRRERRLTLEDEMRQASSSYSEEENALIEMESGELVGVGQRSKKMGFLAHGGSGGEPVFMGVEGVESQGVVLTKEKEQEKTRERNSIGGKRRPKR